MANILRPVPDTHGKRRLVISEKRAQAGLVIRQISRDFVHKVVGAIVALALIIRRYAGFSGLIDKPAQGGRRPAGLGGQPLPVAWQQRDLFSEDAELWPAPASDNAAFSQLRIYRQRAGNIAVKVNIETLAAAIFKNENGFMAEFCRLNLLDQFAQRTLGDLFEPPSGGKGDIRHAASFFYPGKNSNVGVRAHPVNYTRVKTMAPGPC